MRNVVGFLLFAHMCKVCVALFVLLSGYGLYKSYCSYCSEHGESFKNAVHFMLRRPKKLLVSYWWAIVPFALFGKISGMRFYSEVYGSGKKSVVYLFVDILGLGGKANMDHMYNVTCWYIALAIALGMIFAKYGFFDQLMVRLPAAPPSLKIDIVLFLVGAASMRLVYDLDVDAIFATAIICFMLLVVSICPAVGRGFAFLGRHSANIFMTHTFFYYYFWEKFIYAPKYPLLVFALKALNQI